jgi:hypothetical protein
LISSSSAIVQLVTIDYSLLLFGFHFAISNAPTGQTLVHIRQFEQSLLILSHVSASSIAFLGHTLTQAPQ